jgi:hypothetical protein
VSKSEKLAELLLSDRERPKVQHNIIPCWSCGHTFVYQGRQGEFNGNFCSMRCQDWHDAGNPGYERQPLTKIVYRWRDGRPMKPGKEGSYIVCAHCKKEFESKGLRSCSIECERGLKEIADNLALMAEAGIEAAPKKRCAAPGCDAVIPKWKNGRQVSSRVTFCSPRCRVRAHRA